MKCVLTLQIPTPSIHPHEQQGVATGGAFLLGIPLAGILASKVCSQTAFYVWMHVRL